MFEKKPAPSILSKGLEKNKEKGTGPRESSTDLGGVLAAKRAINKWKKKKVSDESGTLAYPTRPKKEFSTLRTVEAVENLAKKFEVPVRGFSTKPTARVDFSVPSYSPSNSSVFPIDESEWGSIPTLSEETEKLKIDPAATGEVVELDGSKARETSPKRKKAKRQKSSVNSLYQFEKDEMKKGRFKKGGNIIGGSFHDRVREALFDVIPFDNRYKFYWDLMVVTLSTYSIVTVPLFLAFPKLIDNRTSTPGDVVVDMVFWVDIWLSFRSGYLDEDKYEVKEKGEIIHRYLHGWFIVDFVAALPLDLIWTSLLTTEGREAGFLNMNKMLRFTRVVKKLDGMVIIGYARLVKLLLEFCAAAHVIGCLYFYLGRIQPTPDWGVVWITEFNIDEKPVFHQYMSSLYWAYATLGTVGYGDISAVSTYERIFAILVMLFGSIMYATIFGTITTLIQERDRNRSAYLERIVKIKDFVKANGLPGFIRSRLLRYHEASWQLRKIATEDVLDGVPESAKIELMMFLYSDLVTQVPIFSRCPKRFLEKVVMCFHNCVYLPGDYIIRQGDIGNEVYFIVVGSIEVYVAESSGLLSFDETIKASEFMVARGPGTFIGEGALLHRNNRRGASVVAVSPIVQAMVLSRESFEHCVADFPEVVETIKGVAAFRGKQKVQPKTEGKKSSNASIFTSASGKQLTSFSLGSRSTFSSERESAIDEHQLIENSLHTVGSSDSIQDARKKHIPAPAKENNDNGDIAAAVTTLTDSFHSFAETQNQRLAALEAIILQHNAKSSCEQDSDFVTTAPLLNKSKVGKELE